MTFFCFSVSKYATIYRWAYQSSHISEYCFLTAQVWQGVVLCAVAHIGMITKRHINISPHAFTCLTALVWFVYTVTHLSIICNLPCLSLYISSVVFMHHTFKRIPLAMYMYHMLSSKYHWHTLVICIIYICIYIYIAKRHGRSVLRNWLTTRFKVGAKIPRPEVEGFLPPPRTEWWVNWVIPTAHVVSLLSHTWCG